MSRPSLFASGVTFLIKGYRTVLSPLLGPRCRFSPTCSQYALDAVRLHGGLVGTRLAIRRIMRCHPLGGHGYDPVPEPEKAGRREQNEPPGQAKSLTPAKEANEQGMLDDQPDRQSYRQP